MEMAEQDNATPNVQKDFDLFGDEFTAPVEGSETQPGDTPANPNTATDEPAAQTEKPSRSAATTTQKFRREIDLGDGSGKQVFEADSADALIDKLTSAQENATRKIREQQFELKRAQRAKPERETANQPIAVGQTKQLSADELYVIGQELQTNPAAALDKILQAQTGLNTSQLKAIGTEFANLQQARLVNEAETTFLQEHQGRDYLPTPDNARAIQKFLQDEKLPYTAANLEYAFQELSEGGLLDMPSSDSNNQQPNDGKGAQEQRIAVPAHTRRKPMSTGLRSGDSSARQTTETETNKAGMTESEVEEIYRLPLDQARTKMLAKMRTASASGSRR